MERFSTEKQILNYYCLFTWRQGFEGLKLQTIASGSSGVISWKHHPYCHHVNGKYAMKTVMSRPTLHVCITSRRTTITMAECVLCVCAETRDVILRSVITKLHHQQLTLHAYFGIFRGFCRSMCTGIVFQMISSERRHFLKTQPVWLVMLSACSWVKSCASWVWSRLAQVQKCHETTVVVNWRYTNKD